MSMGKHSGRRDQRHLKFNGRYHSTAMQAVTNPLDPTTMILVPRKPKKLTANELYQAKRRQYKKPATPEEKAEDLYATTGGRPGSVDI